MQNSYYDHINFGSVNQPLKGEILLQKGIRYRITGDVGPDIIFMV
jgi:hypothetical protein